MTFKQDWPIHPQDSYTFWRSPTQARRRSRRTRSRCGPSSSAAASGARALGGAPGFPPRPRLRIPHMGPPFLTIPFLTMLGRFGAEFGSILTRFGAEFGSIWTRFGVDLGTIWGRFGIDLGSFWERCGEFWETLGYLGEFCQERYCQERRPLI